nr:MAG TPA: The Golgi pH Regulator (GPHR) Family N-terminal [Bacteriophage sp.]
MSYSGIGCITTPYTCCMHVNSCMSCIFGYLAHKMSSPPISYFL